MRPPFLVAAPVSSVVSLADLKLHLRVDNDAEDDLITSFEAAAVSLIDGWSGTLGRAIMSQTWAEEFDSWGNLRLLVGDVVSVTTTYTDSDGNQAAATTSDLKYDICGAYVEADGPSAESIRVEYVSAMNAANLPSIQQAVKLLVGHWYQNREAAAEKTLHDAPMAVNALLAPLRRVLV